jgi:hypothetical protein
MNTKLLILGGSVVALFFLAKRSDARKYQLLADLEMHKKCIDRKGIRGPLHDDDECRTWLNSIQDDKARYDVYWNHVYRDKKPF